jgi:hypothetical protein
MVASSDNQQPLIKLLVLFILTAFSGTALAGILAGNCTGSDPSDCTGDQSSGISVSAPPNTLNVFDLSGPIQPASGTAGIQLQSTGGLDLTINSGTAQANVGIVTTQAPGISILSKGTPPAPQNDLLLNVPIPGTSGVPGGVGQVNSYSDITTSGSNADGIVVKSRTTGRVL